MVSMEFFVIPIEGKYILYRPLRRLAFVGNRAMADLALDLVHDHASDGDMDAPSQPGGVSEEAKTFLEAIGFLEPDPAPPPLPSSSYQPTTAVLLLTSRCNLRCTYCYASGGEGPIEDLGAELAQVVIDEVCRNAQELGMSHFDLSFHGGGEPLQAWESLQEATAYARSKGLPCRVSMVSNGICTARQREWLLNNLDSFSISFDGRQETQDGQRPFASGQGSFKAVMRTIEALDKAHFSYGIRMTATAPWRARLAEDVRFICEETGCPAMQVEPAFNRRRGEHQGPSREESKEFVEAFMEAFEIAERAGRQLTYSGARPWLLTNTFCTAPRGALIVNTAGKLVSCYEITDGNHPLAEISTVGRVLDGRAIVDKQARDALLSCLEERRSACRDCFSYWHCAGDCYTRGITAAAGNPQGSSPRCHMNREITARLLLWYIMRSDGVWRGRRMGPQEAQLMRTF
jgi:uncharacterized protein